MLLDLPLLTLNTGNMYIKTLTFLQLFPVGISLLLIAAHFYRYDQLVLVGVCAGLVCALLIRQPLAVRVIQGALALAAVEWLRTAYMLVAGRMADGYPWMRLATILGLVTMLTFSSIFVFRCKTLRERYRL